MIRDIYVYYTYTDLDHDVGVENIGGKENPEDVVEKQAGQQQRRHLQTR